MDDFTVLAEGVSESTAVVVAPTSSDPRGHVVIGLGSSGEVATRPLLKSDGSFDGATAFTKVALPVPAFSELGEDNQTVLLPGGSLLHLRMSTLWSPHDQPWNAEQAIWKDGGWTRYVRGCHFLFKSDNGGSSWSLWSTIDSAAFMGGVYGYPRPVHAHKNASTGVWEILHAADVDVSPADQTSDENGNKHWWQGGFDRPEMYYCPFTGNLYITTNAVSGPYPGFDTAHFQPVLLASSDVGKNWTLVMDQADWWVPAVMTSTPSGHLVVYSNEPNNNLWRVQFTSSSVSVEGPYDVPLIDLDGTPLTLGYDTATYTSFQNSANLPMPSLARVSSDSKATAVRIAVRALDSNNRQCILVKSCWFGDAGGAHFETIDVVRGSASPNAATLYGGLIDVHPAALPSGVNTRTCFLAYYDAADSPGGPATLMAQQYDGFAAVGGRQVVPANGGVPRMSSAVDPGHCISSYGGAFYQGGALRFFVHWPEAGRVQGTVLGRAPVDESGAIEPPAVIARGAGQIDVIARSASGSAWHRRWDKGPHWIPPTDLGSLPLYGLFQEQLACAAWAEDRLDVVGRGADGACYHKGWTPGGWQPAGPQWEPLGGSFLGGLAMVAWGPERLDAFGRGTDNAIWHKAWTPFTGWTPPNWESLGGAFGSEPSVISWGQDRLDVFGLDPSRSLWHKAWTPSTGWTPPNWENLYGEFKEVPVVVSWSPERIDIVGHGADGAYYHKAWTPAGWQPAGPKWEPLGGGFLDGPAVAAWGPERLDIFGRKTDKSIWHKAWTPSTGWTPPDWESLGGIFGAAPSVVSWGQDRLDLFGPDPSGSLWHKAWTPSTGWTPPKWENLGQPT